MISVLCASTGKRHPYGLGYVGPHELHEKRDGRWCEAANALLDEVAGQPAWFVDDDMEFVTAMRREYPFDVTGFNLYAPVGNNLHLVSCGFNLDLDHFGETVTVVPERDSWVIGNRAQHAHVTASCLWLSARATERLRFPVWQGEHHEDVAFTLQAWLDGLTVGRVPEPVVHHMDTRAGVGATKATQADFQPKRAANWHALQAWIADHSVYQAVLDGRIPSSAILDREAVAV